MYSLRRLTCPAILLASAVVATMFLGCGGSPAPAPAPKYIDVTGNWQFTLKKMTGAHPVLYLTGALRSSGSAVAGTLRAEPGSKSPCVGDTTNLAFTGSLDTSGNLTLTGPISGGVATISVNVTPTALDYETGTYQVVGGTCAQPSFTLYTTEVPNLTGTYTGTMFGAGSGTAINVTAMLVQATAPNSDGQFPLSGSISTTGPCTTSFSFADGAVTGDVVQTFPFDQTELPQTGGFFGVAYPVGASEVVSGTLAFPQGCPTLYNGILTRQ